MKINAQLTFEKIRFDEPRELHLVLTLEAPVLLAGERRPPVCVVPAIDVSGSMAGRKLQYARESVQKLVDHLSLGDFFGAVTFTDGVETISKPVEITQAQKVALRAAIGKLQPQGSTNFAGGMIEALRHANSRLVPEGMVRRVIMFTDGLANVGVATKHEDLLGLLGGIRGGATVSAFGYGEDADHELLRDLSRSGRGSYAAIQQPKHALGAFGRELGGLLSTYAREIELAIRPQAGVTLVDVVSDVDSQGGEDGSVRITIPELLAQEQRQIVIALRVEEDPGPRVQPVLNVEGHYQRVAGQTALAKVETFSAEVAVERVREGEEQKLATRSADEAVALAQLVRAQIAAEERAARGDFKGAQVVMAMLLGSLRERRQHVAVEACEKVLAVMEDRTAYEQSASFRSSVRKGMTRPVEGTLHEEATKLLTKSGREVTTFYQRSVAASFEGNGSGPSPMRRGKRGGKTLNRQRSRP